MAWYNLSAVGDKLVSRVVFNYADALAVYPDDDGSAAGITSGLLFSSSLDDPEILGTTSRWGIMLNPEKMTVINDSVQIKYGQDGSLYADGTYRNCVQIAGGMMRINWSEPVYFWGFLNFREYMNSGQYMNRGNLGVAAALDELIMCYVDEPEEPTDLTIADNLERIKKAKEKIRVAIENKGVAVDVNERIDTYSSYIDAIEVADADGSYDEGYNDGYNQGVEVGMSNASATIAKNAQVLEITENGVYTTKYSQPEDLGLTEITGYFDDGTPFYGYTQLDDIVFKTDIPVYKDSKLEIWWRPDFNWNDGMYGDGLFSTGSYNLDFAVFRKKAIGINEEYITARIGSHEKKMNYPLDDMWYHIVLSKEGLVVNDFNVTGEFGDYGFDSEYIYINTYKKYGYSSANGYFGMLKIDGYTYIPTENGFINYTTSIPLEVVQDGGYNFVGMPESEGNLIRSVSVNVVPKVSLKETGLKLGNSTFEKVPDFFDFEGVTDYIRMFYGCVNLTTIPKLDTSNVTDMSHMFYGCDNLTTIPKLDTSNVTNMYYMFYSCNKLTEIPELDTSKVTTMDSMFYSCIKLTEIPELDTSKVTTMSSMLYGCNALQKLPCFDCSSITKKDYYPIRFSTDNSTLTTVGGFKNMKYSWTNNYGLYRCAALTYESCINILENLYDFTGNGETPNSNQGQLKVHKNFLNVVGDEIAIGTNKGWTITV